MKQIIFESSPAFIILCAAVGLGFAFLLYSTKSPWGKTLNWVLFSFRAIVCFLLAFFLLGPIVKQINNVFEKPVFVIFQDNSLSVKEGTDSVTRNRVGEKIALAKNALEEKGYETSVTNFSNDGVDQQYSASSTNIHESFRNLANRYEGRNLAGVVFISDGIYTSGLSPLYGNYTFPVYTVGVGDTTERVDLMIKNLVYNKIAYEGNKFPLLVEVGVKGFSNETINLLISHKGKVIERKSLNAPSDGLLTFDFQLLAAEKGIQRFDIQVEEKLGEQNIKNNRATVFIEVVEGRKKILLVASAPHPDIKALRAVVGQNSNFEFILHVPGIEEAEAKNLQPENIDLVIFHQTPDLRGRTRELFQRFSKSKTSLFLVLGQSSDLALIAQQSLPLTFEQIPRQFDEVTPVLNTSFSNFTLSAEANSIFSTYPPVQVHFGKLVLPVTAAALLVQKVGSLVTDKPLLYIHTDEERKVAMMLGEGLWRWRLHEYSRTEKTEAFDEVFGKLFQFLSTTDDKRKFRSYPVQQEFADTEPVVFESQVYNDIFEPVFGNSIDIELTDERGGKSRYSYITSPGNSRYPIGGLREGVYRYSSSTILNGAKEEVKGQFLVSTQQLELQNLTADFDLLRKLAVATGGTFAKFDQWDNLQQEITRTEARSIIRSEERYDSIIHLKWIFFLLLLLISAEWFLRKYFGSY
jgi:hypothetical protein